MRQLPHRAIRLFCCLAGAFSGLASPAAFAYDPAIMFNALKSIVMIRAYNADGSMGTGSGVVIAPNKVLTNCHIFRASSQPWVSHGEDTYQIQSVQADRWHDLCLLTTDAMPFPAVELGNASSLHKGDDLFAIGHSGASPQALTSIGSLKSIYTFEDGSVIRSTARFSLGASGSGLFSEDGKLIGINTFKTVGRNAYYYAVPVAWIADVEKMPVDTFPIHGKAFWEEDESRKAYFLQAAVPDLNEDWPKLAEVSEHWVKAEPQSAEAWYELGLADSHIAREAQAELAYQQAIRLDPNHIDALFNLGMIAAGKGDQQEVHDINLTLMNLNKDSAEQFRAATACKDACN